MTASTSSERGKFSAGVRSTRSRLKNLIVAGISSIATTTATTDAIASRTARARGGDRRTSTDRLMCSPRRYATTAPSIASHRNTNVASSSLHTSGLPST